MKEAAIISHLVSKYKPEIVFLSGSRASGTEQEGSDWDLFLIENYGVEAERVAEDFEGELLDISLNPLPEDFVLRIYYGPVRELRVLHDNAAHLGRKIIAATQQAYERGPAPLTNEQRTDMKNEMKRILSKVKRYADRPAVCAFHLSFFYQLALPYWFQLQNTWSVAAHIAFPEIQKRDPQYATLITQMIDAPLWRDKAMAAQHIFTRFFG